MGKICSVICFVFFHFASFTKGEARSTQDKRTALHLFRLGEAMLHIVRNKTRPLLHMMRAWSTVAPHLVEVIQNEKDMVEIVV